MKNTSSRLIPRSSELMWVLGVIFVALGVAFCNKSDLGVSMIAAMPFVLYDAVRDLNPVFSVGMMEYIFQGVLLIILCLAVRRLNWRYLLAFAVAVIYGYTLNFFLWLTRGITCETVLSRWIMLLLGDMVTAVGVACFFRTYLPLQVYELFVAELSRVFRWNITKVKRCFDFSLLAVSVLGAMVIFRDVTTFPWREITHHSYHSLGLGTLVTTVINAYLISFAGKLLDLVFGYEAAFPKMKKLLERE